MFTVAVISTAFEEEQANLILRLLRKHKTPRMIIPIPWVENSVIAVRNNGDGHSGLAILRADCVEDGYIVAPVDVDNNGTQDLVLKTRSRDWL